MEARREGGFPAFALIMTRQHPSGQTCRQTFTAELTRINARAGSRKTDQHGREAHGKGQAACEFDIHAEKKHERRDQQFAARHAKQCGHDADNETRNTPATS
jgi:hypothetical protein